MSLALVASACGDGAALQERRDVADDTTPAKLRVDSTPSDVATRNTSTFDSSDVPRGCDYEGKLIDGVRWSDSSGDHVLLISQSFTREDTDTDEWLPTVQHLFGYCYRIGSGAPKLLWSIKDNVENYCDPGEG